MIEKEALNVMTQAREDAGQAFLGKVQFNVPQYHAVIKALEKQIPKRAISIYKGDYKCPTCENYIDITDDDLYIYEIEPPKCCDECGQALDWGGGRMSNKKFTDEEIKSSLEVIATTRNCNECKIRNCKWGTCNCSQITANAALDLIERQKAELEAIKDEEVMVFKLSEEQMNEIEEDVLKSVEYTEREIKAEAYKEFAERLKEKLGDCCIVSDGEYCGFDCGDIHQTITNLLKEMVGGE